MEPLPPIDLPLAPNWSLALGSIGRGAVIAAASLFVLAVLLSIFKPGRASRWSFVLGCVALFSTFAILATLFLADRFEFSYVYGHAQHNNAFYYKIAGIWSGQQGSFLLWACCSALFGLLTLRGTGNYERWFTAAYAVFLACISGILAYESPFVLEPFHGKYYVPPDGVGLVPSLQNYWVVIHPPTIFLGFGSLTVLFAYACSALITRSYDDWAPRARPWAIVSVTLLALGLCMGGFWAYETLGWGGFWKWDPVENVSFIPWCFTVVLVHGLIVQSTRKKWQISNLLMAGLPFIAFVYGTFLTRAGFLDGVSVHSFAQMDSTAHKVLLTFCLASTAAFALLWGWRAIKDRQRNPEWKGLDREDGYRAGNLFLILLGLATLVGTSVPLFQVLSNKPPKVVEEPIYHMVLGWFFVPIILLVALVPFLTWKAMGLKALGLRVLNVFSISLGLLGVLVFVFKSPNYGLGFDLTERIRMPFGSLPSFFWINLLLGLCLFAGVASVWRLVEIWKRGRTSAGAFISHLGVAMAMAGLIVSRGFERHAETIVQAGAPASALEYFIEYKKTNGDLLDRDSSIEFDVRGRNGVSFVATPGLYYTPEGNQVKPMVWPFIERKFTHDLYLTLHPPSFDAGDPISIKPGETKEYTIPDFGRNQLIKYKVEFTKLDRIGEAGKAGTKFVAVLSVTDEAGHATNVAPYMELGQGGVQQPPAMLNSEYFVTLAGMDAASKAINVQFGYVNPLYPIELFYKPMTGLVWLGTGILTLGGFLAAWNRRTRKGKLPTTVEEATG